MARFTGATSKATDIILELTPHLRKGADKNTTRRAIAHGKDDSLVLNYKNSYPGGVIIESDVELGVKFR